MARRRRIANHPARFQGDAALHFVTEALARARNWVKAGKIYTGCLQILLRMPELNRRRRWRMAHGSDGLLRSRVDSYAEDLPEPPGVVYVIRDRSKRRLIDRARYTGLKGRGLLRAMLRDLGV